MLPGSIPSGLSSPSPNPLDLPHCGAEYARPALPGPLTTLVRTDPRPALHQQASSFLLFSPPRARGGDGGRHDHGLGFCSLLRPLWAGVTLGESQGGCLYTGLRPASSACASLVAGAGFLRCLSGSSTVNNSSYFKCGGSCWDSTDQPSNGLNKLPPLLASWTSPHLALSVAIFSKHPEQVFLNM